MNSTDKALCIVLVVAILSFAGCQAISDYARNKYECVKSQAE